MAVPVPSAYLVKISYRSLQDTGTMKALWQTIFGSENYHFVGSENSPFTTQESLRTYGSCCGTPRSLWSRFTIAAVCCACWMLATPRAAARQLPVLGKKSVSLLTHTGTPEVGSESLGREAGKGGLSPHSSPTTVSLVGQQRCRGAAAAAPRPDQQSP